MESSLNLIHVSSDVILLSSLLFWAHQVTSVNPKQRQHRKKHTHLIETHTHKRSKLISSIYITSCMLKQ